MNLRSKVLSMGMESFEGTEVTEHEMTSVPVAEEGSISDELLEMNEAAHEAEVIEEVKDEAMEVVEGLESLIAQVQGSLESRGLSPEAAVFVNMHAESLRNRVGMKSRSVGVESYENGATRLSVTRAGLEDLKTNLRDIWQWVLDLLNKAKKAAADFFNKILGAASRLEKAAQAQVEQAGKVTGGFKETKVKVAASHVGKLHLGGKLPTNFNAGLTACNSFAESIFNDYAGKALDYGKALIEAIKDADPEKEASLGEASTALTAAMAKAPALSGLGATKPAATKRFDDAGFTFGFSEELLGGKLIYSSTASVLNAGTEDNNEEDAQGEKPAGKVETGNIAGACKAAASTFIAITSYADKAPELKDTDVAAYGSSDVIAYAEIVAGFAGVINRYRNKAEDSNKVKDDAIRAAKSLSAATSRAKDLPANVSGAFGSISKLLSAMPKIIDQPKDGFAAHLMSVGNEMLRLNAKMLANIKQS